MPIATYLNFRTDLDRGVEMQPLKTAFVMGDRESHVFAVQLYRSGGDGDLPQAASVTGYFIRADGATVAIPGMYSNGSAVVQLPAACYAVAGRFFLLVKTTHDGIVHTVLWCEGTVSPSVTDVAVDPGEAVPSLDQLLAQIAAMEEATAEANAAIAQLDGVITSAPPITITAEGTSVTTDIAANRALPEAVIYGRTVQDGTPSPDSPAVLNAPAAGGRLVLSVTGEDAQYVTIEAPGGLHGIPVASGGNYTDASGQQWLADEIDLAAGTVIRRFHAVRLTSTSHVWNAGAVAGRFNTNNPAPAMMKGAVPMCSHFVGTATFSALQTGMVCNNDGTQLIFATSLSDLNAWKNWLDNNEVWLVYRVSVVKAEKLPDDVLATFRAMRTSAAQSSIINDAGAWMRIGYVADTKAYIDRMLGGDA